MLPQICDFGLARSAAKPPPDAGPNGGAGFMTEYVATRWYRAPEVMLSRSSSPLCAVEYSATADPLTAAFKEYTRAIDIWSVGCILAEMITGKPLFPGRDYHHQLSLILDILGTPTMDDFYEISSARSRDYLRALPFRKRRDFQDVCLKANPLAVDLMRQCLTCVLTRSRSAQKSSR
jgi:mitogen-activated protein kinase 1/3